MSNKILIDASHPEETRVVVTKGSRIEEFDFESDHKKQLKGNIYLARVTRVEPSLQAAFIEYGGNRHGFLAFSEIHPDYYQLPTAERESLDAADIENSTHVSKQEEKQQKDDHHDSASKKSRSKKKYAKTAQNNDVIADDEASLQEHEEHESQDEKTVDLVGSEDALEEVPSRDDDKHALDWRDHKIQEVIKRRQILLVQVVKEERGNKGAALTTYLSLAGRYSVLMPNTARGGGISRKITNTSDRKRLKDIVKDLAVPQGMGIILRTAGASRTKAEVRRDYEYLMRLWENVRNLTLTSMAPALVYEEGSLIKRSIRDLYNKNIDQVLVAGDKGYREAKDFMRMLMPSHAKFVQRYKELTPIFARQGIEAQLDSMLQPEADLKSGGYLVINQTEALVAIDVNSGRSTKEHSIEETALQTNLEAAEEVARQLRLRDLAGLIVIDFIDMQDKRNIRAIEKKLKDCLKDDRARIQVGRISHFGLMEMSRQRIRASVLESTTQPCPHCFGLGYVRSESSLALHVLRVIEEYLQHHHSHCILVRTLTSTALYVLNHKRRALSELESRFGITIDIEADDSIGKEISTIEQTSEAAQLERKFELTVDKETKVYETEEKEHDTTQVKSKSNKNKKAAKKSKENLEIAEENSKETETPEIKEQKTANADENAKRRRRRGRRGGRRNREQHTSLNQLPAAELVGPISKQKIQNEDSTRDKYPENLLDNSMAVPEAEPVALRSTNNSNKKRKRPNRSNKETIKSEVASAKQENDQNHEQKNTGQKRITKSNEKSNALKKEITDQVSETTQNNTDSAPLTEDVKVASDENVKPNLEHHHSLSNKTIPNQSTPVVTSSNSEGENISTKKKQGWWGRKNFF